MTSPETETSAPSSLRRAATSVSLLELFLGFLKCGLLGFGGVAPWARHIIVEERKWLSGRDYAALLGVGQALPGANTVNAAVMIGDKFQGAAGSVVCVVGLMTLPLVILVGVATVYRSSSGNPLLEAAITGAAAAAAGLIFGTAIKMVRDLALGPRALLVCAGAFIAIAVLRLPFVPVLAVLIPLSIFAAALERRK